MRLVEVSSTRPGDAVWDPGTVEAGAERAADDPTSIAYLGELDLGGSAVSLPVTNRAGLLQVAPADGLTSLTRVPPGRPRAGPDRYYPEGRRTFVRLVPSDLAVGDAMLRLIGSARTVAIVHTDGFAERELAGMLAVRLRRAGRPAALVEPVGDDTDSARSLARDLKEDGVQAILFSGVGGAAARSFFDAVGSGLPGVPVVASAALASPGATGHAARRASAVTGVLPAPIQPPRGRRLLRSLEHGRGPAPRVEALYGYDAMRLVLRAIDAAGPDRAKVVRAALSPRRRAGATGRYAVARNGDVEGRRLALVELGPTGRAAPRQIP